MKIIISVGSFSIDEIRRANQRGFIIYHFDPRCDEFEKLKNIFDDYTNIFIEPKAVDCYNGKGFLYLNGTKSSLGRIENCPKIEVEIESLASIIKEMEQKYEKDSLELALFLNCEGGEVPIILNTPIEELKKFSYIKIEFHLRLYPNEILQNCVSKLSSHFNFSKRLSSITKHPTFSFSLRK